MTGLSAPLSSTLPTRLAQRLRQSPRLLVLLWAIATAIFAGAYYGTRQPQPFMQSRMTDITASIAVLDRGGPPLLASSVPYGPGVSASALRPVGATDDQGIYVVLPLLGHLTGEHDPAVLMQWFFAGSFTVLLFVLPLLAYELFGSLLFAAAAPALVLAGVPPEAVDLYWILAWCTILGLPALLLAYRWWRTGLRRRAAALLTALMVAASFATSIRVDSGLPILIGALGIVLFAGTDRWRRPHTWSLRLPSRTAFVRPLLAGLLVVAYLSIASFGLAAIRDYRNSAIHEPGFGSTWPTQHPFWHNAYIGLGYLPNRYGISWSDEVAADVVERAHPGTQYLSPRYETTLRHAYLRLVRSDPGFVLRTLRAKARVIVADALRRFWLAPALLALALSIRRRRREAVVTVVLAVPALVLGAAAPILTLPTHSYAMGWLAAWATLLLLGLGWTTAEATRWVRHRRGLNLITDVRWRAALPVAALAVLGGLAALGFRAAPPPDSTSLYKGGQSAFAGRAILSRPALAGWAFHGRLPRGWKSATGTAHLQPDDGQTSEEGLHVTTGMAPRAEQLTGPTLSLRSGRYELVGSVRVLVGGMAIVVRDAHTGAVLASSRYWASQGDFLHHAVAVHFVSYRPRAIRVSLANWSALPNASSWVLWRFALDRTGSLPSFSGYYRPRATPLLASGTVGGKPLHTWSFSQGVPLGWRVVGAPKRSSDPRGLRLVTSLPKSAYQLQSDVLALPAGRYVAEVDGRVTLGGLELGVLDARRDTWILTRHFWHGQRFAGRVMTAVVDLPRAATIQVLLSNWAPSPAHSSWVIRRVSLRRVR